MVRKVRSVSANTLLRKDWDKFAVRLPVKIVSRYQRELIEARCVSERALLAFCHAVAVGDIKIENNRFPERGPRLSYRYDNTGVFDDDRCVLKGSDGRILNPTPFTNNFLD